MVGEEQPSAGGADSYLGSSLGDIGAALSHLRADQGTDSCLMQHYKQELQAEVALLEAEVKLLWEERGPASGHQCASPCMPREVHNLASLGQEIESGTAQLAQQL